MTYVVGRDVLDGRVGIPITEQLYQEGRRAQVIIFLALAIEQKFNLTISNYEDLERELLSAVLRRCLYDPTEWSSLMDDTDGISRRVLNLLSSGRLFTDHLRHDISRTLGKGSDEALRVSEVLSSEYEASLGYRVGEALRNFVQHRSLPVSEIEFPKERSRTDRPELRAGVRVLINTEQLAAEGGFKASVLNELREIAQDHDMIELLRKYVQSLANIRDSCNAIVAPQVSDADGVFEKIISLARTQYDSVLGLVAARVDDETTGYRDLYYVMDEPISHRQELHKRNRKARTISTWHVCGGFRPPKR